MCGKTRGSFEGRDLRPAVNPVDATDMGERPAGRGVVGVEHEVISRGIAEHGLSARTFPIRAACEDERAAAFKQRDSSLVHVRPRNRRGAADADVVSALRAAAAPVEGDEEVGNGLPGG